MGEAFGHPGAMPTWATGDKTAVGTAANSESKVWFTIAQGIVNEVYYPRIDSANMRDGQFLVTAENFFSEEKDDTHHVLERLDDWAPAFRITNTCVHDRYRIVKEVVTDPGRNVLLQQIAFEALSGTLDDYSLYAVINPHMGALGYGNDAWIGEYNGIATLYAARDELHMAVASSVGFTALSAGFVGHSDGWQDLSQHHTMTWEFSSATDGNVALTGRIGIPADKTFTLAIGFGATPGEAAQQAHDSLAKGFAACRQEYVEDWRKQTAHVRDLAPFSGDHGALYRSSIQVLFTHQDKTYPGATVASLSVPWGEAQHADERVGGYHLVWPRDLVETAVARVAADDLEGAKDTLLYLADIQTPNGGWHQNTWLDGSPYWDSVQLDETAYPILLAWHLHVADALDVFDPWPMVKKAASYLALTGPITEQERWEENGGYSLSTLSAAISALICAAEFAMQREEMGLADYLRSVADWWASNLDNWTYARTSDLVPGTPEHYERINTVVMEHPDSSDPEAGVVPIGNLEPEEHSEFAAKDIVGGGFLKAVYFGIKSPHDPHIVKTVQVIDKVLKVDLPAGPCWHRYNHDGYGEKANGDPFEGAGVGQAWPLLTGERAHYELAAGNLQEAQRLVKSLEGFAGESHLLPEQVWTGDDIPDRGLFRGRANGSARPLVWAHAEYIKVLRSIADGKVFGTLPMVADRYKAGTPATRNVWRFNHKVHAVPVGNKLRIETLAAATLHWSADNWVTIHDDPMVESGVGSQFYDIPSSETAAPCTIVFTFYWTASQTWENRDFAISVEGQMGG
ncbi:MAG: glycoside hydrolase family 15 protein [Firmicutes bacterium]|nr:glycoside hydrolase family 15 protein [Bacillota bacterium]